MKIQADRPGQQEYFGVLLGQIARRWRLRLDRRLQAFGLTEARWLTLLQLARGGGGLVQKELAARVGVEGPTLVRTLDRLEQEGLVVRHEAVQDRRAKTVHLTDKATPTLRLIEDTATEVRAELLAGVTDAELDACKGVLERIAGNLAPDPQLDATGAKNGHRAA
jgi:MarR family transcriptional regulator for hemolysin